MIHAEHFRKSNWSIKSIAKMSTSSVPHSVELDDDDDDDVASAAVVRKSRPHKKYATLEKCNSLINLNGNLASLARSATSAAVNFEWYKQFRRNARVQMMKSRTKSTDAAPSTAAITLRRSSSTMQYNSSNTAVKAVNRDGTIARNHFRGVPGDFLDKHTKHFLLSMTVSIIACDTLTHKQTNPRANYKKKKKIGM